MILGAIAIVVRQSMMIISSWFTVCPCCYTSCTCNQFCLSCALNWNSVRKCCVCLHVIILVLLLLLSLYLPYLWLWHCRWAWLWHPQTSGGAGGECSQEGRPVQGACGLPQRRSVRGDGSSGVWGPLLSHPPVQAVCWPWWRSNKNLECWGNSA